jgi:Ribbon-helix-helix protein, copG family
MKSKKQVDPRNKGLTKHISFTLTSEDRAWLDKHANETEVPITAIIRRAFRLYREAVEKKAA